MAHGETVLGKAEQKTRLTDTRIADDDQLEQVVVALRVRCLLLKG